MSTVAKHFCERICLTAILFVAFLLIASPPVRAQGEIACGETVSGHLSDHDYSDKWLLSVVAGERILITMTDSPGLEYGRVDSFLSLFSPGDKFLKYNDDISRRNSDARIEHTIEHTGTHSIRASRAGDEGGSTSGGYELHVRCQASYAESMQSGGGNVTCGETVSGHLSDENYFDHWLLTVGEGERINITMWDSPGLEDGHVDSFLSLYSPGDKFLTYNDDISNRKRDAGIEYFIRHSGTYTISARRQDWTSGGYRLEVDCAGTGERVEPLDERTEEDETASPTASSTDSVTVSDNTGDAGSSTSTLSIPHGDLLGIEHVACTANDIYFILRLKSDTPVREHLLEVFVSTDGSAVLADILPMPKHQSLPDRLLSVVSLAMVGEGVNVVTGFPLAGSVFHAGAELTEWIDEQFTRSSSPLHFRLTWYNTDAHPGIERYLVHATRSGTGNLRVASRVAPLSEAASWANRVREQDTYSTLLKDTIDLAVYWMGGDPGGPGLENERADAAVDIIAKPLEWVADTVLNEPVAYFAERFFIEEGVTAEPVEIC